MAAKTNNHSWWQNIKQHPVVAILVVVGSALGIALVVVITLGYWLNWHWTGLVPETSEPRQHAKTLWDWLQLLIIPLVLAVAALLFNLANSRTERQLAKQRYEQDQQIALDKQREDLLQAYLDRMSELLLKEQLGSSEVDAEVRNVARVRTITVLSQLDGRRIGYVFTFLREAGLMSTTSNDNVVSLSKADLHAVNWSQADLSFANLSGANLSRANLSYARLWETNLSGADLSRANLSFADLSNFNWYNFRQAHVFGFLFKDMPKLNELTGTELRGTELIGAKLREADLSFADLKEADLSFADLREANLSFADLSYVHLDGADLGGADLSAAKLDGADLDGADLSAAKLDDAHLKEAEVTVEQLAKAKSLENATMPNGTKYWTL